MVADVREVCLEEDSMCKTKISVRHYIPRKYLSLERGLKVSPRFPTLDEKEACLPFGRPSLSPRARSLARSFPTRSTVLSLSLSVERISLKRRRSVRCPPLSVFSLSLSLSRVLTAPFTSIRPTGFVRPRAAGLETREGVSCLRSWYASRPTERA